MEEREDRNNEVFDFVHVSRRNKKIIPRIPSLPVFPLSRNFSILTHSTHYLFFIYINWIKRLAYTLTLQKLTKNCRRRLYYYLSMKRGKSTCVYSSGNILILLKCIESNLLPISFPRIVPILTIRKYSIFFEHSHRTHVPLTFTMLIISWTEYIM